MDKILTFNKKVMINSGGIIIKTLPTIAFLPDTQSYVNYKPGELVSQIDYLINNKDNLNLKFVAHEGDLVQNHDNNPLVPTGITFTPTGYTEWSLVEWQMGRLMENSIPYSTLPGNHDYVDDSRDSTMYNSYFPLSKFSSMDTYGGSYDTNSDNMYHIIDMDDGHQILIMSLEFGPRTDVLTWANNILQTYSTIPVIVVTHGYVSVNSTLLTHSMNHAPSNGYGLGNGPPDVNDASGGTTSIYKDLVYPNNNVRFVISGHDGSSNVGSGLVISEHSNGTKIYQILANYQYFNVNQSGYLLLLTFDNNKVYLKTYSPWLLQYKTDEYSQNIWDWEF